MKTYYPKENEVKRKWYVVDLKDQILGRAACEIVTVLTGKNKPTYSQSVDVGDCIIAINSDQIKLTGNKLTDKVYYRHTGAIGGIRSITAEDLLKKDSTLMIYEAVKGMLPKNKLGRHMLKKLKIYKGAEHNQTAQHPEPLVAKAS